MRFTMGIDPQSLSYRFLNEITDHPCSNWGPTSNRIECTKFNKGCIKFNEGCTKGSKVRSEVGMDPQSLSYEFLNEIMDHLCSDGVPEAVESDIQNFVKDVPRSPKCVLRWGPAPKHFLMGSKMKLWTIHVQMGVPKAIGSDVPNFMKDVARV